MLKLLIKLSKSSKNIYQRLVIMKIFMKFNLKNIGKIHQLMKKMNQQKRKNLKRIQVVLEHHLKTVHLKMKNQRKLLQRKLKKIVHQIPHQGLSLTKVVVLLPVKSLNQIQNLVKMIRKPRKEVRATLKVKKSLRLANFQRSMHSWHFHVSR